MSKGLGKLQLSILKVLNEFKTRGEYDPPTRLNIFKEVEIDYYGDIIQGEHLHWRGNWFTGYLDKAETVEKNKRRASMSRAMTSLINKGYVVKEYEYYRITDKGVEVKVKLLNT